jgi:hypothetical protein
MSCASAPSTEGDELLDLPELGGEDEQEGVDDPGEVDLRLPDAGDESPDDEPVQGTTTDLGLELGRSPEPSALGDDATGLADVGSTGTLGLMIDEHSQSLLDHAEPDPDGSGEDADTGLEPLADDTERTDAEGLDDAAGERLDVEDLPALDVGGDDEVEVGIELEPPPSNGSTPGADPDAPASK